MRHDAGGRGGGWASIPRGCEQERCRGLGHSMWDFILSSVLCLTCKTCLCRELNSDSSQQSQPANLEYSKDTLFIVSSRGLCSASASKKAGGGTDLAWALLPSLLGGCELMCARELCNPQRLYKTRGPLHDCHQSSYRWRRNQESCLPATR